MTHGSDPSQPRVVILGGGFGGLSAARSLRKAPVQVTLVDRRNFHLFQPLLYQVATAALSPGDIAQPIRSILRRQKNAEVILGEVLAIDPGNRRLVLQDGTLSYDFLILTPGARHSYFGRSDWEAAAPGLKSLEDALEIRGRVLRAFEAAEREAAEGRDDRRRVLLTFVVVGGGPTGVELAGALAEISRWTLVGDFRAIDPSESRVLLIEAGPRVLPSFPEALSTSAAAQLARLGVEVRTSCVVKEIVPDKGVRVESVGGTSSGAPSAPGLRSSAESAAGKPGAAGPDPPGDAAGGEVLGGSSWIEAGTILWAAGVEASPIARSLGVPLDRAGRVIVEPDLTIPGRSEIFVVGDLASFSHQTGRPLAGVAQVAIQQGRAAARSIVATLRGEPRAVFHYRDPGNLATIGRSSAVADFGRIRLTGWIAWVSWCVIHIFFLIGFRNRLVVSFEWAWAWFTRQRGARLITEVRSGQASSAGPGGEPHGPGRAREPG